MTQAPSVSFSPAECLCSSVRVSLFFPLVLLSLPCHSSSIPLNRCSLQGWPVDLCQPQLIKSDTSSTTARWLCHVFFFRVRARARFFRQSLQYEATLPHVLVISIPTCCCQSNGTPPALSWITLSTLPRRLLQKPFAIATNQLTE